MDAMIGHNQPTLRDELAARHEDLLKRRDELLAAAERAPLAVEDEETAGKVQDFIKQIAACHKNAEAARVAEKEPHLDAGRMVDGYFKAVTEPLAKAKKAIEDRLTVYLRKKADAERRAREEAERLAREEAQRKAREAAEAAAKLSAETDLAGAIEAEEAAKQAEANAVKAASDADAKSAELSRTRGEYGSVGSLRTFWDFEIENRNVLDLETLRPFIPLDALEKAVRGFVKAGGRSIKGARIFENTSAVVR